MKFKYFKFIVYVLTINLITKKVFNSAVINLVY